MWKIKRKLYGNEDHSTWIGDLILSVGADSSYGRWPLSTTGKIGSFKKLSKQPPQ